MILARKMLATRRTMPWTLTLTPMQQTLTQIRPMTLQIRPMPLQMLRMTLQMLRMTLLRMRPLTLPPQIPLPRTDRANSSSTQNGLVFGRAVLLRGSGNHSCWPRHTATISNPQPTISNPQPTISNPQPTISSTPPTGTIMASVLTPLST